MKSVRRSRRTLPGTVRLNARRVLQRASGFSRATFRPVAAFVEELAGRRDALRSSARRRPIDRKTVTQSTAAGRPSCAILVLNWNGIPHLQHLLPSLRAAVARVRVGRPSSWSTTAARSRTWSGYGTSSPRWRWSSQRATTICSRSTRSSRAARGHRRHPQQRHARRPGLPGPAAPTFCATRASSRRRRTCTTGMAREARRASAVCNPPWVVLSMVGCAPSSSRRTPSMRAADARHFGAQFVELGGFDPLYRPAYFEDVDLSYRAWMRGWRTVYEPESIIYHRIGATLGPPSAEARMQRLLARNHALCTMKNVADGAALVFIAVYQCGRADALARRSRRAAVGACWRHWPVATGAPAAGAVAAAALSPPQIAASLTARCHRNARYGACSAGTSPRPGYRPV